MKRISAWWFALLVTAPVALWAAATGITTQQTKTSSPGSVNLGGVAANEGTSLGHARADHVHSITGTLPASNGGTGLSSAADDAVMVGNGSTWQSKTLPSCTGAMSALQYSASTNTISCVTLTAPAPTVPPSLYAMSAGSFTTYSTTDAVVGGGQFNSSSYSTVKFQVTGFVPSSSATLNVKLINVTDGTTASTLTLSSMTTSTTSSATLSLPSSDKTYEIRYSVNAGYYGTLLWAGLQLQ